MPNIGVIAEHSTKVIPLSVAIPAYNRRNSVQALLESVCGQVGDDDEVVVCDDNSEDGTAEMASAIPKVRVVRHQTNQGIVANWNACLTTATRDWICIVHDDDGLEPGALAALRRACTLANGPALITHQRAGNRFDNAFRCYYSAPNSWSVLNCPTIPSGAVIHRTVVDEVGLFDPRFKYSPDLEYFPRVVARFPLLVIESPHIVDHRLDGDNYRIKTWHEADFYGQLEELQLLIISYAGIQNEELKRSLLDERMVANLLYMLNVADRIGDRDLVRQIGRRCQRFHNRLSAWQAIKVRVAAGTGQCLSLRRVFGR